MELWRELLISGLQDTNNKIENVSDKALGEILESKCYQVLLEIKRTIDDEKLQDADCYIRIEEIIRVLEENCVFCDRHDFG